MRSKLRKLFPLLAVLLLSPWPIAYAYDYANASPEDDVIQIEIAESSTAPKWQAFGKTIGGVNSPGDLFYIGADEYPADIMVTLSITNTNELSRCYKYLILKVGIYVEGNSDEWAAASSYDGQPIPDTFITLRNGQVSFRLTGDAKYRISIDSGSFHCITANADGGSVSPQFYLTADQA
jgi:hypothetical protein